MVVLNGGDSSEFWAFVPVAVQIHDHQHPMDHSLGQTTPPVEEDEWGMMLFSSFFFPDKSLFDSLENRGQERNLVP